MAKLYSVRSYHPAVIHETYLAKLSATKLWGYMSSRLDWKYNCPLWWQGTIYINSVVVWKCNCYHWNIIPKYVPRKKHIFFGNEMRSVLRSYIYWNFWQKNRYSFYDLAMLEARTQVGMWFTLSAGKFTTCFCLHVKFATKQIDVYFEDSK